MTHLWVIAAGVLGCSSVLSLLGSALRRYSMLPLEERFTAIGRQKDLERFLAAEDSLVLTVSVWRVAANVSFGLLLAMYLSGRTNVGEIVATSVASGVAILVLSVAIPIAWATCGAERVITGMLPVLFVLRGAIWPLLAFLGLFHRLVRRLAGAPPEGSDREDELESELLGVVKEGEIEGAFEEDETEMIESIIEFKDTDVAEIMTPRTEMSCVPQEMPLSAAREQVIREGHSRVPAYQENLDMIVGVLYAKDLLAATGKEGFDQRQVGDIMRPALFIPETKKLTELLHDFQQAGVHIAMVLDEYGGTAGLVTIEDVIEEIVGEITDEFDASEPEEVSRLSATTAEVGARTRMDDVNDELDLDLPEEEDYDTIGGFVFSKLGTIPAPGETLSYRGLTITVTEADPRRVVRLRIEGLDKYVRRES